MRTLMVCSLATLLLGSTQAQAEENTQAPSMVDDVTHRKAGKLGVGLGAGSRISGISAKYWLSDTSALQVVLGGAYAYGYTGAGLSVDYLVEMPPVFDHEAFNITWSAGLGVGTYTYNGYGNGLTVSGVGGLEFNLKELPVEVAIEYRPGIYISNGIFNVVAGAVTSHARWYF